jgi:predicted dinucleotide-binding enzyme
MPSPEFSVQAGRPSTTSLARTPRKPLRVTSRSWLCRTRGSRDIIGQYGDQLAGKIVVDVTNPVDFETFDSLLVPAGSSASLELAAELPSARVLKAFNTTFATTLATKTIGPNRTTVLVAGDDAEAKATLISAITAGGVDALDVGALGRAHELEAIGLLQVTLAAAEKISWTGGFALVR